jgi:hypothetical protein
MQSVRMMKTPISAAATHGGLAMFDGGDEHN